MGSRPFAGAALNCALAALLTSCATPRNDRLAEFEAVLAANPSATVALGQWCGRQRLADPPLVTALPVVGAERVVPGDARALLGVGPAEQLGFRHVRLSCGGRVLSEADNWYVPARLSAEMNAALATTDIPFGKVAAPLHFSRERLASTRGPAGGCPQATILSQRAVLRLPDGRALALVTECYTQDNLHHVSNG